jgi:hypothetical protein
VPSPQIPYLALSPALAPTHTSTIHRQAMTQASNRPPSAANLPHAALGPIFGPRWQVVHHAQGASPPYQDRPSKGHRTLPSHCAPRLPHVVLSCPPRAHRYACTAPSLLVPHGPWISRIRKLPLPPNQLSLQLSHPSPPNYHSPMSTLTHPLATHAGVCSCA